jgi:hypothetical protein
MDGLVHPALNSGRYSPFLRPECPPSRYAFTGGFSLYVARRRFRWFPAFAALMYCWSLSGCGHSEYGSLDLSKTKLGLEGEVIPKGKAASPPVAVHKRR